MIRIKKGVFAVVLIIAVLCGAAGVYFVEDLGFSTPAGSGKMLSEKEYAQYEDYLKTYKKAEELKKYVLENYYIELDEEDVNTGMYRGIFDATGDIYSYYMTPEEYEQFMISMTGEYSGIGATLAAGDSGYVEVVSPTKGSPAEAAGIRTGDLILAVDGVEYTGAELDKCAAAIRGDAGTDVTLTMRRGNETYDLTITRAWIISKTVEYEMLEPGMGYISLSSFENHSASDFEKALRALEKQGASSFVLDLRNNPGGFVDVSVEIADMLMNKGTVAYTEDHDKNREYYKTSAGRTEMKYVVLINEGSASSSEILAAGIKDNSEGLLIGTQSYGKGIIQSIEQLKDGSAVKLTTMQYFSPSGEVIHGVGISPDIVVELTDDCYSESGELIDDLQLKRAQDILRKQ